MLFTLLKSRIRKRRLAQFRAGGNPVFLNLRQVRNITFLFKLECDGDVGAAKGIINELNSTGIPVKGVVVEVSKIFKDEQQRIEFSAEVCEPCGVVFIGKKELNWLGIPVAGKEKNVLEGDNDLLIAFNDNGNFTLEYLVTRAKGKCIVGMENKPNLPYNVVFENSIAHKGEHASAEYVKHLLEYLKNIESSAVAAN